MESFSLIRVMLEEESVPGVLAAAWLAAAVLLFGCSSADQEASANSEPPDINAAPADEVSPSSLVFAEPDVPVTAGKTRELTVQIAPPGEYEVHFALLGTALDASLSSSVVLSDPDGVARVMLTAPASAPATFMVRASVHAAMATATVNVESGVEYATIQVEPRYSGKRTVTSWVASAHVGTPCSLLGNPPPDSDLSASVPATDQPQIGKVSVGKPIAITVRGDHLATGCTDVSDVGSVNRVTVDVFDLPLKLDDSFLVDLTLETVAPAWQEALLPAVQAAKAAVSGQVTDDIGALLDAMQSNATAEDGEPAGDTFGERRTWGNWETSLRFPPADTTLPGMDGSEISSRIERWMQQAIAAVPTPCVLSGRLDPAADPTGPNGATFTPLGFAGMSDPMAAGFASRGPTEVSWSADANDTLSLGGKVVWLPTRLLATLARTPATLDQPGTASVPAALAQGVDCSRVATILVRAGANGGENGTESYPGCSLECTQMLCERALEVLWQKASDAKSVLFGIDAAAPAVLNDEARPVRFDGRWVGTVELVPDAPIRVQGAATGTAPDTGPAAN